MKIPRMKKKEKLISSAPPAVLISLPDPRNVLYAWPK
jgi:hypothetical protein